MIYYISIVSLERGKNNMQFLKRLLPAGLLLALTGCGEASSVGVIGGADGPTAVFVTTATKTNPAVWPTVALVVIAAVIGVIVWLKHRK